MGNVRSILAAPDQTLVTVPKGYTPPPFPSLYSPTINGSNAIYLYYAEDMWRFTVFWTVIVYGLIFLGCGLTGALVFCRRHPVLAVLLPVALVAVGTTIAVISGSIVGLGLAAVYNAAHFNMATWVPFLYALIQALILAIGSYNTISAII